MPVKTAEEYSQLTVRGNSLNQFGEATFIHSSRQEKTDIALRFNARSGERILGNIDKQTVYS